MLSFPCRIIFTIASALRWARNKTTWGAEPYVLSLTRRLGAPGPWERLPEGTEIFPACKPVLKGRNRSSYGFRTLISSGKNWSKRCLWSWPLRGQLTDPLERCWGLSTPPVGNDLTHRDATASKGMLRANLKTSLSLGVVFLAYLQKQGVSQQTPHWSLSIIGGVGR